MTNFIKLKIKNKLKKQNEKFQKLLKQFLDSKTISVELGGKLIDCLSGVSDTIDRIYEDGIDPIYHSGFN